MPLNYVSRKEQSEIEHLIDQIQLTTGKTYPEDSLIDIIKAYIPGISILEHDFEGDVSIRGAIYKKSVAFNEPLIVIQRNLDPAAKTFTLAHEFGHYCLDHPGAANYMIDRVKYDGTEEMQKEAEAQYFAASLLMPRDKFLSLMNFLSEEDLAKRFGVSRSAIRVKKAWLNRSGREEAL